MKLMLEEVVKSGAEEPEVFGLHVHGGTLGLYVMDIKSDGIYRLIDVDTLNLVTNFTEIFHLSRTMVLLHRFKDRALAMAKRLEAVELQRSKGQKVKPSLPLCWFRKSADPKMKVLK